MVEKAQAVTAVVCTGFLKSASWVPAMLKNPNFDTESKIHLSLLPSTPFPV